MAAVSLQLTGTAASFWRKPSKPGEDRAALSARQQLHAKNLSFQPSLKIFGLDLTHPTVHTSPLRPDFAQRQLCDSLVSQSPPKYQAPSLHSAQGRALLQQQQRSQLPRGQPPLNNYNHRNIKRQSVRNVERWRMEEIALRRLRYVIDQHQITSEHMDMLAMLEKSQVPGMIIQKYFGQSITTVYELRIIVNKLCAQHGIPVPSIQTQQDQKQLAQMRITPKYERSKGLASTPLDLLKIVEAAFPITRSTQNMTYSTISNSHSTNINDQNHKLSASDLSNVSRPITSINTTRNIGKSDHSYRGQVSTPSDVHNINAFHKPPHHCYGHCPSDASEMVIKSIHREHYRTQRDHTIRTHRPTTTTTTITNNQDLNNEVRIDLEFNEDLPLR